MRTARTLTLLAAASPLLLLGACDSITSGRDGAAVAVKMGVATGSAPAGQRNGPLAPRLQTTTGGLAVSGDNGVLTISEMRLIVSQFELKTENDTTSCDSDDCEDFEAAPQFLNLPLNGSQLTVAAADIPNGTYQGLEFEVKNLDDRDDDDGTEAAAIAQLRQLVQQQVPDWPAGASMLVSGTFQPRVNGTLGAARAFRVFLNAEVEVEMPLSPPLVVSDSASSRSVSVDLDPAALFRSGTQVLDLSQFDGQLIRFEAEMEQGFHHGGNDDSGDDDNGGDRNGDGD